MFDDAIRSRGRLILSLVFVAACAACAGPTSSTGAATSTGTAAITSHPSVGALARGIADPACGGGTGTVIPVPPSWLPLGGPVVTEMLPGGITLVVASAGYPPASYALAYAFTPGCAPDRAFGSHGVERLAFGGQTFSIATAIPAPGGGTILGGSTAKGWLVARLGASGSLDPAFGSGGWTVLPWPGGVTAIAVTPSGDIVLGATYGGGAGVAEWVGELNADGGIVSGFGSAGRSAIPVYRDDSVITRVWAEPDGEIFAFALGGDMGCWGINISALTSSGSPVPSFMSNFTAAMGHVSPSGTFVGEVIVRSTDFLLLGTEQSGCVTVTGPSRTAQGRVAAFQLNGELEPGFAVNGEASFNSPMADTVWALPRNDGGFVMADKPFIQSSPHAIELSFFDFSADGNLDRAFGNQGVAHLLLPYHSQSLPDLYLPTLATNGQVSALVTSTVTRQALRLIQLSC